MEMGFANAIVARSRRIVVAASCAVGVAMALTGVAQPVENMIDAMRVQIMPRHASDKLAVIEIDDKSIKEIHAWPWPRSIHANLVRRLRAEHAARISFDVDFSSSATDARQDAIFAKSLAAPGAPVSLAATKQTGDLPNPTLAPHASTTSVWIDVGNTGVARSVTYGDMIGGKVRQSIAAFAAGLAPNARTGLLNIDWSIKQNSIPVFSYSDVLSGRVPASQIEGRAVIIGATAVGMGDHWVTPVDPIMQGVMVHAYGANTLLLGGVVPMGRAPLLMVACILLLLSTQLKRRWQRNVAIAAATLGTVAVQWTLRNALGWELNADAALSVYATAAALLASISVLSSIVRQITTDPSTSLPNLQAMRIDRPAGPLTVAVRLRNYVETTALLGPEAQILLLRKVYDRLDLGTGGSHIYQADEHSFAWRTTLSIEQMADIIEALHALFVSSIQIGEDLNVDAAITVGICDDGNLSVERAIAAAMVAADRAAQRNLRWERYETDDDADWKLSLLGEVDRAIDNNDMWVAYQPKWNVSTKSVTGAEALIRWTHPTRGFIAPDRFIPVVEEAGRIEKLTMYVLERAISDFAPLGELTVAVNLSTRLLGRTPLVKPVQALLAKYGMDPRRLTLEITESAQMANDNGVEELIALRDLGVTISIDDYGTGQSTLSYLQRLPASELKIDKGFVQKIPGSRADLVMIDSTIKLAHTLGLKVVAEGVENDDVLQHLASMECDVIQGYFICKPVPLADFVKFENGTTTSLKAKAA